MGTRMKALTDSGVFWVAAVMLLTVLFMLPTLIGLARGVDQLALVFLVNLIGAPALIGWPAALILAFGPRRQTPQRPRRPRPSTEYGPGGLSAGPDRW
jgi:hypothetical protein